MVWLNLERSILNKRVLFFEFDKKYRNKIDALIKKLQKENLANTKSMTVSHLNLFYLKYKGTDQSICIKEKKSNIKCEDLIKNFGKFIKRYTAII